MKDILDYIGSWPVLKWVLLVLVAGFIGQFGKMLADAIMEKARRRRDQNQMPESTEPSQAPQSLPAPSVPSPHSGEMPDKKQLKTLLKARKKETKNK